MSDLAACSHPSDGSISIQFLVQMDQCPTKYPTTARCCPAPGCTACLTLEVLSYVEIGVYKHKGNYDLRGFTCVLNFAVFYLVSDAGGW